MRCFGELSNRQRRIEVALRICHCALDTVGFWLQLQQCRELRLATGAAVRNDQLPCHGPGAIRAKILFNHGFAPPRPSDRPSSPPPILPGHLPPISPHPPPPSPRTLS